MRCLPIAAGLLSLFLIAQGNPAGAAALDKATSAAIGKGATDTTNCLPQGDKATFDGFRACIAKHVQTPGVIGAKTNAYHLGLVAQAWLLVNLQSLKAMDAADKASGNAKAAAQKSANVLQDAAHDYFVAMRSVQDKVKLSDADLCGALGLPYDQLKDYFDFYDHWQ